MSRTALLLTLAMLAGCSSGPSAGNPRVEMVTNMGTIKVELFEDKAPKTVKNFLTYVDETGYPVSVAVQAAIEPGAGTATFLGFEDITGEEECVDLMLLAVSRDAGNLPELVGQAGDAIRAAHFVSQMPIGGEKELHRARPREFGRDAASRVKAGASQLGEARGRGKQAV